MCKIIYPYEVTCTHQAVEERRMTMGFQWQLLVPMDCFWCEEELTCAICMINEDCYSATYENYRKNYRNDATRNCENFVFGSVTVTST